MANASSSVLVPADGSGVVLSIQLVPADGSSKVRCIILLLSRFAHPVCSTRSRNAVEEGYTSFQCVLCHHPAVDHWHGIANMRR